LPNAHLDPRCRVLQQRARARPPAGDRALSHRGAPHSSSRRSGLHSVNCGDHYAYVDRTIHHLNYLQFSDADWRIWNNRFLYQNRLRAVDFVTMARAAGFGIELDTSRCHPMRLQQLDTITVHPQFERYSREQLAITSIDFIGRNP
jgi:hypothetical protein